MLLKLPGKNYDILSRRRTHRTILIIIDHDYAVCKRTLRHCEQPQLVWPDRMEYDSVESNANLD